MPHQNIDRLKVLLEQAAHQNDTFLRQCSEAKILALRDFDSAVDKYREIALEILSRQISVDSLIDNQLQAVKSALQYDILTNSYTDELKSLRSSYFETVLKPAVNLYLKDSSTSISSIEHVYSCAVEFDKLLEVVEFFRRINS